MKLRNAIQAAWPGFWLVIFTIGILTKRELSTLLLMAASGAWLSCALALHPGRRWTWWACFVPLLACGLLGIMCLAALFTLELFPDYWGKASQPGAVLIASGLLFLVPTLPLLGHLWVIRRAFHEFRDA